MPAMSPVAEGLRLHIGGEIPRNGWTNLEMRPGGVPVSLNVQSVT